jgi:peptidoglycan/LPS O-acetylase OafA/YrhL
LTNQYRADIDGLRGIAVLAVILSHFELGTTGGYTGVDIFFVLSGFLITGIILKEHETKSFSFFNFSIRRVRRIAPALCVMSAVSLALATWVLDPDRYAKFGRSLAFSSLGASNIFFWRSADYFAGRAEDWTLLHTWSLGVEEQFYLFYPLAILLLWRYGKQKYLPILLLAIALFSFALSAYGAVFHKPATYYLLPTRAWELLSGGLTFILCNSYRSSTSYRWANLLSVVSIACLLTPIWLLDSQSSFPGFNALPTVLGTSFLLAIGSFESQSFISKILGNPLLVFTGKISYSLYLWHWPILSLATFGLGHKPVLSESLALIALSFLIAVISYQFVERPFRLNSTTRDNVRTPAVLVVSLAFLFLLGSLIGLSGGAPWRLRNTTRNIIMTAEKPMALNQDATYAAVPGGLTVGGDLSRSKANFFVWGDSHALSLLPALSTEAEQKGWKIEAATLLGTPPTINLPTTIPAQNRDYNAAVLNYVKTMEADIIVFVAFWSAYQQSNRFGNAVESFNSTFLELRKSEKTIILVHDNPIYPVRVPSYLCFRSQVGLPLDSIGIRKKDYEMSNDLQQHLSKMVLNQKGHVVSTFHAFTTPLNRELALPYDDNGCFYYDDDHLSSYGASKIAKIILKKISEINN